MFTRIAALFLMMAFVAQTFSSPFIMLDYYANTTAYAKSCINKARPKMHCNGKCQVMKKIKEEEKKEQQNSERRAGSKIEVLSKRSFYPTLSIPGSTILSPVKNAAPYFIEIADCSPDFFHPPQVI